MREFRPVIAVLLLVTSTFACSAFRSRKHSPDLLLTVEIEATPGERAAALNETIAVLESRLNAVGVSNFEVKPYGDPANGRILISIFGAANPGRLKSLITAAGKLELAHVISPPSPMPCQTFVTKEAAIASLNQPATNPENRRVLPYIERAEIAGGQNKLTNKWVIIELPAIITASDLRTASAAKASGEEYVIRFALKATAAERFAAWTAANINQYLGVVLNDEVRSIAFIKSPISDQGEISGHFTQQSAEDLALVLKSGSLPFPIKVVNESTPQ